MKIGYARVSTDDQNPELQIAALKRERYTRIFADTASGSCRTVRGMSQAAMPASLHTAIVNVKDRQRPEYRVWRQAVYDGRLPLAFCTSFAAFWSAVGRRPSPRHVLAVLPARKANSAPTVAWMTRTRRIQLTRQRLIRIGAEEHTITGWAQRKGLTRAAIYLRLTHEWTIEQAILTPRNQRTPISVPQRPRSIPILVDRQYGHLTVLGAVGAPGLRRWQCRCYCGKEITVREELLRQTEPTPSCGCRRPKRLRTPRHRDTTAGKWTPEYTAWVNLRRFRRDSAQVPWWPTSYPAFLAQVGRRPSPQHVLRAIPPRSEGAPGSLTWVHQAEMQRDWSGPFLRVGAQAHSRRHWAQLVQIGENTIRRRLALGWTPEQAVLIPTAKSRHIQWPADHVLRSPAIDAVRRRLTIPPRWQRHSGGER